MEVGAASSLVILGPRGPRACSVEMTVSLGIAGPSSLQPGRLPTWWSFDRQTGGRIFFGKIDWASLWPWAEVAGALSDITAGPWGHLLCPCTHRSAHHVAQAKVESTLLVHGIVQPWELRQSRPVMGEGIVTQAVIGTVRGHVGATDNLQCGS